MPKRTDIKTILVLGSGPIVIGQACEFDYSGTQGIKSLREDGYRIILANSNPATIMTDPGLSDRTYIEPLTPEMIEMIIAKEKPQALLPTLGGQTALNLAVALAERGTLKRHGVELIGANRAGLFINLVPILGTLLSIVILGEAFEPFHAVAMVLVMGGIAMAEISGRRAAARAKGNNGPLAR